MRHTMDEWPLALFTALAIAGGGTIAGLPLLMAIGAADGAAVRSEAAWATLLVAVGLGVSMNHLGWSRRFALAARRAGASALSTEAVLAGATLVAGAALAWTPESLIGPRLLVWVSGPIALAFLLSIGLVYRLPGQLTWPAVAAAGPLLTGFAFGLVAHAAGSPNSLPRTLHVTLAALAADALVFGGRWAAVSKVQPWLTPSHLGLFAHRRLLLLARLVLVTAAPATLLAARMPAPADLAFGVGLLVDRLAFYGLAVQHTTEAEIERVERVIQAG